MIPSILDMPDKTAIIKEAQKYLSRGQIDKAIFEWEKLLAETKDANIYNTIGDLYLKKGEKKSAMEYFHKAAKGFWADGFSLKALALYKKIINVDPSDADSLFSLGELSEGKGLVTDAIKYYLSAADILSRDMKKDKFLTIYEKILSLAPTNIPLREKVAGLFVKEGLISNAIKEYLHIAKLFGEKGDSEQEVQYLSKVLDIRPDNRDALLGLSSAYERKGDPQRALDHAKKALALNPDDPESLQRCALLSKESGRYDDAIAYLSRIVELHPFDPAPRRLTGEIYHAGGNREKAWESYRIVVDSLMDEKRFSEAAALAEEFRDLDPAGIGILLVSLFQQADDMEAACEECVSVAGLLSDSDRQGEALTYYREALKIRPDDVQLKRKIAELEIIMGVQPSAKGEKATEHLLADADIFVKYGLYDEAGAILEDLKIKEPWNTDVHTKLKALYININDTDKVMAECIVLADLYEKSGDTDKREAILREAAGINPEDSRLLEREKEAAQSVPDGSVFDDYSEEIAEAEFYLRQGLPQDALRIYQKLLGLFPDNAELQKKLTSIQGATITESSDTQEERVGPDEKSEFEEFTLSETEAVEIPEPSESHLDSDVLDIFEEFKKGLEQEIGEEDYETHYNLGIAYKEMGLTNDAIKEFQTSRKDPIHLVRSTSMLGICYMEKGLYPLAIEAFRSTLSAIHTHDDSYWGTNYDLALAYEKNGDLKEAFEIFSEIYGWDSQFREVAEKLNNLKIQLAETGPASSALGRAKGKKDRISYL